MRVRHRWVCTLLIFANCSNVGQASGTLVDDLVQHWQKSKALALAMARAMPEEFYSRIGHEREYTPEQEYTPAHQLNGVALTAVLGCTMALQTRAPERFQSAFDRPMDSSKAGVIENLTEAFSYCIDGLQSLTDADVLQTAVYKGRRATRFDIFWDAYARTTFVLGGESMFMRSRGLTPPDVGPRYDF
jgi:hypothetical protein